MRKGVGWRLTESRGTKAPPPMTGYLGEHTWSQPKVRDNRDD